VRDGISICLSHHDLERTTRPLNRDSAESDTIPAPLRGERHGRTERAQIGTEGLRPRPTTARKRRGLKFARAVRLAVRLAVVAVAVAVVVVVVVVVAATLATGERAWAADAPSAPPTESVVRAAVFSRAPVIDGEVEAGEWPEDAAATIHVDRGEQCLESRRARWRGTLDASVVATVGVDADALYFLFRVTDDTAVHPGEPWWWGDSLEVFLNTDLADDGAPGDPTRDRYTDDDWQLFFMPGNPNLRWGVAYHGPVARFDDAGLVGVRTAAVRGAGGSYTLEVRLPLANFPGLSGLGARRIGFALALNDVDRFVAGADPSARPGPDPATYLSWNGKGDLYRHPGNFGVLELPARRAAPTAPAPDDGGSSTALVVAFLLAATLTAILVGPGSRRLARTGARPKAALLALNVLLAGFLALSSACQERGERVRARTQLDDAVREAGIVAEEADEAGALVAEDAAARARTLRRILAGERVPCLPPVTAHGYVRFGPLPGEPGGATSVEDRILLDATTAYDWPLPAPVPARALRLRLLPIRDVSGRGADPTVSVALGVLHATTEDGTEEDLPIETRVDDGGERTVTRRLAAPEAADAPRLVRLRWRPAASAPSVRLLGMQAVVASRPAVPLVLPGFTEDRVPVLTRPGARPSGPDPFHGIVVPPQEERAAALPSVPGADRLWLAVTVERGFPLTRHGQEVAEVRVEYTDGGRPTTVRLRNGEDVDEERLNQAIKHPADMRSRVAYRWTDESGIPRHHDLVAVPVDYGRRAERLVVRNLSPTGDQGTGAFVVASATLARHATDVAGGRLTVTMEPGTGEHRAFLADPKRFAGLLEPVAGDAVRVVTTVGRGARRTPVAFSTPVPAAIAARSARTRTALLTCLGIALFLLVLLVVDLMEAFRRISLRLVFGVLAAALVPVAATVLVADHRNASRLEGEREARLRGWLGAARAAVLGAERQEAKVGAQGLVQLVTSAPFGRDVSRLVDQVGVFRRTAMSGGGAWAVLVRGRDLETVVVQPDVLGATVDGAAYLADRVDAPGLYVSPWDGLLLTASARSVGADDWRKIVVALRVDDAFVRERVAAAILDPDAEVAVLARDAGVSGVAGVAGPAGEALGRAVAERMASLADDAAGRDAVLFARLPTAAGDRVALVSPLPSADAPDVPAAWLAVAVAREALDTDLRELRTELVLLGLAAAVLIACVAATLARRISGPVRDLVAVTEAVRRGEFDVEVPPGGTDEVGDLAVAFDQMRRDLKLRLGDLDFVRRVQERVAGSLDLARTCDEALAAFRERYAPPVGVMLLALSPTGPVSVRAEHGRASPVGDRAFDAKPSGWLAAALAGTEPVVVEDAATDPRVASETAAGNRLLDEQNAFVAVPLRAAGEPQGLLLLAWPGRAALPGPDARALMSPLAGVVGMALHNARLYRLAALDEATSLPGATSFEAALRRDVEAALAGGPGVVVLRIGLDGLDRAAVRRGVETQRALLRAAADALRSALGGRVQAGRLSDDELAVRAPGATREEGMELATQVRERIAAVELRPDDGGDPVRTPVAVGLARCPDDAKSVEFLLDAAGRALVAARRDGGERVVDVHRVEQGLVEVPPFEAGAIFRSERMVAVLDVARRAARADSTVLLTGETGVGKEVIADLVHRRSLRAGKPFVKVNAAALPETLLESELFGHERGAFTGADRRREGRFELADGGTLFLDEVGEMSLTAQVKLLRVLAEGQFTRLGGTKPVTVDVRVVAATNQELEQAVATGRFREDLYFRLNVLRIEIPPLRERREEIPSLVEHFLAEARRKLGRGPSKLTSGAMDVLYRHPWPGNVRELRNVIERAAVMCEGDEAGPEHLRLDPPRGAAAATAVPPVAAPMDALNERQRALLAFLAQHGRCTNRQYIEMTSASERTGLRDLHDLMKRGLIVREGKRRGAVYRLP